MSDVVSWEISLPAQTLQSASIGHNGIHVYELVTGD